MNGIFAILVVVIYIGIFYVGYWILRKAIEEGIYRAGKRLYQDIGITSLNKQEEKNDTKNDPI